MYPNLYYAFKDWFGVEWNWLKLLNSFGFFVAMAFIIAAWVLTNELKRKKEQGLFNYTERKFIVGNPASTFELITNFFLGFLLGFKIIAALINNTYLENPQEFILSSQGNWVLGIVMGLAIAGLRWYEANKQKKDKPEERIEQVYPHDRVGDIVIYAAVFGFLGAKIFHNLENWDEFIKEPIASLISFSGLTFYGGLICAALAIYFYARKNKIPFIHLADAAAPALMLSYAIGRVGCQVSGDGDWGIINSAFISNTDGHVVAATHQQFQDAMQMHQSFLIHRFDSLSAVHHLAIPKISFLPDWTVAYTYPHNVVGEGINMAGCQGHYCAYLPLPVFPTPFYEFLMCSVLFVVLMKLRNKLNIPGKMFGLYLILNGTERFFIEKIRVNTVYSIFGFHPTQAEIISSVLFISGLILLLKKTNKNISVAV